MDQKSDWQELYRKLTSDRILNSDDEQLINEIKESRFLRESARELSSYTYLNNRLKDMEQFNSDAAFHSFLKGRKAKSRRLSQYRTWIAAASIALFSSLGLLFYNYHTTDVFVPYPYVVEQCMDYSEETRLLGKSGEELVIDKQVREIHAVGDEVIDEKGKSLTTSRNIYSEIIVGVGKRQVIHLCDGSKVCLNGGSKMKFYQSFDSIRHVELEGEAFFTVKKSTVPFVVTTKRANIRVYGTSFNVSAYQQSVNSSTTTTLITGSIGVESGDQEIKIKPGEEVIINNETTLLTATPASINHRVAWMSGRIAFANEDLYQVMQRLQRHYQFSVRYVGLEPKLYKLTGRLSQKYNLEEVILALEKIAGVRIEVDNQWLVVKPIK